MAIDSYYVLKRGALPGPHDSASANLGGTCAAWLKSEDRDATEVVAVSASGVVDRLTQEAATRIANSFLHPDIR